MHGTWSHGESTKVSPASAPLQAICFLEKTCNNQLLYITNRREINGQLLACAIRPFVTKAWLQKTFDILEILAHEVPCFTLHFDRSGAIVHDLLRLLPLQTSTSFKSHGAELQLHRVDREKGENLCRKKKYGINRK